MKYRGRMERLLMHGDAAPDLTGIIGDQDKPPRIPMWAVCT